MEPLVDDLHRGRVCFAHARWCLPLWKQTRVAPFTLKPILLIRPLKTPDPLDYMTYPTLRSPPHLFATSFNPWVLFLGLAVGSFVGPTGLLPGQEDRAAKAANGPAMREWSHKCRSELLATPHLVGAHFKWAAKDKDMSANQVSGPTRTGNFRHMQSV